jgi:hypothetical protein
MLDRRVMKKGAGASAPGIRARSPYARQDAPRVDGIVPVVEYAYSAWSCVKNHMFAASGRHKYPVQRGSARMVAYRRTRGRADLTIFCGMLVR